MHKDLKALAMIKLINKQYLVFLLVCTVIHAVADERPIPGKQSTVDTGDTASVYHVAKLSGGLPIDADWNKPQWQPVKPVVLSHYMGEVPAFKPYVEAKMMYDTANVYVIFHVKDHYVRSVVQEYNGSVSQDACVEFFFAPDTATPEHYFNLEINAGGTPLLFYVTQPRTSYTKLDSLDIMQIEIAHSLPKVIDPEITEPTDWTIEYRIPLHVLEKFSDVSRPAPGVTWRANFYKTASKSINPHWITWSPVNYPKPNFHLPQYFGKLVFE